MKRKILALALGAFVLAACQLPTGPSTTNTNTNTNNINLGRGGLDDPNAVAGQCLESERIPIRVDLTVPTTATVNQNTPIDATPKSAAGKRSDGCNVLQGIYWTTTPSTTCYVPNPTEFNTAMVCRAAGDCVLSATVPGTGATGSATVACR